MWVHLFLLLFAALPALPEARRLGDIYWNSSNPIFDMSNTDHVKSVRIFDRVNIICPKPLGADHYEFSKLYAVNRRGYERCELIEPKLIGVCLSPQKPSSMSIVFRDFSPLPGALEFRAGHNYYIISTSNGSLSGIDNTSEGLCKVQHMKLKFEVLSDEEHDDPKPHTQSNEYDAAAGSPTNGEENPVMYIIHTINPDSEDDGFAGSVQPNLLLLSLCLVTAMFWLQF
uniref:Ephrin RBD domain-containing protein n=1 Tax=Steinernema glaseri TaxID=37863 RepID=A0A1I8AE47_9BILA